MDVAVPLPETPPLPAAALFVCMRDGCRGAGCCEGMWRPWPGAAAARWLSEPLPPAPSPTASLLAARDPETAGAPSPPVAIGCAGGEGRGGSTDGGGVGVRRPPRSPPSNPPSRPVRPGEAACAGDGADMVVGAGGACWRDRGCGTMGGGGLLAAGTWSLAGGARRV